MAPVYALDGALAPVGLLAAVAAISDRPGGLPAGDPAGRACSRSFPASARRESTRRSS